MLDLFVLDIAGTTVQDYGLVVGGFEAAAERIGLRPEGEFFRVRMGRDKREIFRELLALAGRPEGSIDPLLAAFERAIEDQLDAHPPRPLAGVVHAMRCMQEDGTRIGFTTGFSRSSAESILRRLDWPLDYLVGSDEVEHGRPAPDLILECMRRAGVSDAARVGACGDTPYDLQAAAAAGCGVIVGVGHGTHTLDELSRHPHTHLIPDFHNLREVIYAPL